LIDARRHRPANTLRRLSRACFGNFNLTALQEVSGGDDLFLHPRIHRPHLCSKAL
jgi:hypothetical protein